MDFKEKIESIVWCVIVGAMVLLTLIGSGLVFNLLIDFLKNIFL